MGELAALLASVVIFAVLARFSKESALVLCCFIKGAALILISNWVLGLLALEGVSLNLFTAPLAGLLGVPAVALLWIVSVFF